MIIDIFNHLPEPEHVTFELLVLSRSPGYLQLLGPSIGRGIGMSDEEVKGLVQAGGEEEVLKILLSYLEGRTLASEVLVAQMDRAGIDWTILHAEDNGPRFGVDPLPEEFWVGILQRHAGRFALMDSVHPLRGRQGILDFKRRVRELGFIGLFVSPFQQKLSATDPAYDPLFRACIDLDVPVWIHAGIHWDRQATLDVDRPNHFDELCVRYPELNIIAGHVGWPWVLEMVALAWKHPRLYLDVSAHRPRYMNSPGSGWEPLFHYGDSVLRSKVMVGTASLFLGLHPGEVIEEFRTLPLRPESQSAWLGGNASRVFGLGSEAQARGHVTSNGPH